MTAEDRSSSTTLVGVVAQNGIVMATDKQVTKQAGSKSKVRKLEQISPRAVMSTAGSLSGSQNLLEKVKKQVEKYKFRRGRRMSLDNVFKKVGELTKQPSFAVPIFAGYNGDITYLYEFGVLGSRIEYNSFVSVGSGSKVARGSLESQYEDCISIERAKDIAISSLENASEHGIYTGEGIDIAHIDEDGVQIERNVRDLGL